MHIVVTTPRPGVHCIRFHPDEWTPFVASVVAVEEDEGRTLFLEMLEHMPDRAAWLEARPLFPRAERLRYVRRNLITKTDREMLIDLPPVATKESTPMTTHASLLATSALIPCIIHHEDASALTACPHIEVNGQRFAIAYNTGLALPIEVIEVARGAGMNVELLESPAPYGGNGDAAAAEGVGGQPDGSGGLDAYFGEPILVSDLIEGNPAPSEEAAEPLPPLDTFDAEAIVDGTVEVVAERLDDLDAAELEAVREAELDREVARKGVIEAIDEAAEDLTA